MPHPPPREGGACLSQPSNVPPRVDDHEPQRDTADEAGPEELTKEKAICHVRIWILLVATLAAAIVVALAYSSTSGGARALLPGIPFVEYGLATALAMMSLSGLIPFLQKMFVVASVSLRLHFHVASRMAAPSPPAGDRAPGGDDKESTAGRQRDANPAFPTSMSPSALDSFSSVITTHLDELESDIRYLSLFGIAGNAAAILVALAILFNGRTVAEWMYVLLLGLIVFGATESVIYVIWLYFETYAEIAKELRNLRELARD